jgi:adenylate cyclase
VTCSACGAENSSAHKFCSACGASLRGAPDPSARIPQPLAEKIRAGRSVIQGERKQVTVMFVDIVGSMDLAERLDPELWRSLLDRFLVIASRAVRRVEGTIHQFTGDGVLALFGAPVAHEDHARRACLAALELHSSLGPLAPEAAAEGLTLAIRVGLNSGEVIVGEIGDEGQMDYSAIGHTMGLAQRMESLAPPGSTALSASTAALVAGEFELRELGEFQVKGSSAPRRVYELAGTATSRDRVRFGRGQGDNTPFVGRDRERLTLEAALERALAVDGQVVGLVGEPGVGKSRLAHEFAEYAAAQGANLQRVRAVAHGREVPLLPVLELMRNTLGVADTDDAAVARERIGRRLRALDESFDADLPLLLDFLGVADPERPAPRLDPDVRQRQLLSLIRRFVEARSAHEATVTVIEDLHWLDDASSQFLAELVRAAAGTRTLLILTYRPEYAADVLRGSHCEQLALRPLGRSAVDQLLASLLGDDGSLDGLSEIIAGRAVGNPFFCEELVAALAESGHLVGARGRYRLHRTLEGIVLPATVQATLAARIDRLGEHEKQLLQLASVIGGEVSEPLLQSLADLPRGELGEALQTLVSAELLTERMGNAGVEYAFKHPLTHEVAYRSQLGEHRRHVHRQVALAVEQLHPDRLDERAALIAQHWEAAGEPLPAASWSGRAAAWVGLSDMSQALAHWRRVAVLTDGLPDSPEAQTLARLSHVRQLDYGWRLGMSEHEATEHYLRAKEILERNGDGPRLIGLTALYATLRGFAGHLEEYEDLSEEADRLSSAIGDPTLRIATLVTTIQARFVRGRIDEAVAAADEAIALGADDPLRASRLTSLVCPYAWCLMIRGWILATAGRLAESGASLDSALAAAREYEDVETQGWTHMVYVFLARYSGERTTVLSHGQQSYEIAERMGSAYSRVWQTYFYGCAQLMAGELDDAIEAIERSIALAREARTALEQETLRIASLAEARLEAGDVSRAIELADRSISLARERGNRPSLPYGYRVLAEAVLASERPDRVTVAQDALQNGLAAAKATGAFAELPMLERVAASLTGSDRRSASAL